MNLDVGVPAASILLWVQISFVINTHSIHAKPTLEEYNIAPHQCPVLYTSIIYQCQSDAIWLWEYISCHISITLNHFHSQDNTINKSALEVKVDSKSCGAASWDVSLIFFSPLWTLGHKSDMIYWVLTYSSARSAMPFWTKAIRFKSPVQP